VAGIMARGISLPRASGGYACDELVVNVRFILRRVDDLEFAACPVMGNERYRLDLEIPQPPVRGFLSLIVGPGASRPEHPSQVPWLPRHRWSIDVVPATSMWHPCRWRPGSGLA
jgi:hypothetical protein